MNIVEILGPFLGGAAQGYMTAAKFKADREEAKRRLAMDEERLRLAREQAEHTMAESRLNRLADWATKGIQYRPGRVEWEPEQFDVPSWPTSMADYARPSEAGSLFSGKPPSLRPDVMPGQQVRFVPETLWVDPAKIPPTRDEWLQQQERQRLEQTKQLYSELFPNLAPLIRLAPDEKEVISILTQYSPDFMTESQRLGIERIKSDIALRQAQANYYRARALSDGVTEGAGRPVSMQEIAYAVTILQELYPDLPEGELIRRAIEFAKTKDLPDALPVAAAPPVAPPAPEQRGPSLLGRIWRALRGDGKPPQEEPAVVLPPLPTDTASKPARRSDSTLAPADTAAMARRLYDTVFGVAGPPSPSDTVVRPPVVRPPSAGVAGKPAMPDTTPATERPEWPTSGLARPSLADAVSVRAKEEKGSIREIAREFQNQALDELFRWLATQTGEAVPRAGKTLDEIVPPEEEEEEVGDETLDLISYIYPPEIVSQTALPLVQKLLGAMSGGAKRVLEYDFGTPDHPPRDPFRDIVYDRLIGRTRPEQQVSMRALPSAGPPAPASSTGVALKEYLQSVYPSLKERRVSVTIGEPEPYDELNLTSAIVEDALAILANVDVSAWRETLAEAGFGPREQDMILKEARYRLLKAGVPASVVIAIK